jgi:cytochrome c-type biogenesis protein CcmE
MSKRLVVSLTVLLIVGIAVGILGVMLIQSLHLFTAPTVLPNQQKHW